MTIQESLLIFSLVQGLITLTIVIIDLILNVAKYKHSKNIDVQKLQQDAQKIKQDAQKPMQSAIMDMVKNLLMGGDLKEKFSQMIDSVVKESVDFDAIREKMTKSLEKSQEDDD
ncbi:MAG: hypothetical protein ACFFAS_18515 [Promethearchaeota archaeon]